MLRSLSLKFGHFNTCNLKIEFCDKTARPLDFSVKNRWGQMVGRICDKMSHFLQTLPINIRTLCREVLGALVDNNIKHSKRRSGKILF